MGNTVLGDDNTAVRSDRPASKSRAWAPTRKPALQHH